MNISIRFTVWIFSFEIWIRSIRFKFVIRMFESLECFILDSNWNLIIEHFILFYLQTGRTDFIQSWLNWFKIFSVHTTKALEWRFNFRQWFSYKICWTLCKRWKQKLFWNIHVICGMYFIVYVNRCNTVCFQQIFSTYQLNLPK